MLNHDREGFLVGKVIKTLKSGLEEISTLTKGLRSIHNLFRMADNQEEATPQTPVATPTRHKTHEPQQPLIHQPPATPPVNHQPTNHQANIETPAEKAAKVIDVALKVAESRESSEVEKITTSPLKTYAPPAQAPKAQKPGTRHNKNDKGGSRWPKKIFREFQLFRKDKAKQNKESDRHLKGIEHKPKGARLGGIGAYLGGISPKLLLTVGRIGVKPIMLLGRGLFKAGSVLVRYAPTLARLIPMPTPITIAFSAISALIASSFTQSGQDFFTKLGSTVSETITQTKKWITTKAKKARDKATNFVNQSIIKPSVNAYNGVVNFTSQSVIEPSINTYNQTTDFITKNVIQPLSNLTGPQNNKAAQAPRNATKKAPAAAKARNRGAKPVFKDANIDSNNDRKPAVQNPIAQLTDRAAAAQPVQSISAPAFTVPSIPKVQALEQIPDVSYQADQPRQQSTKVILPDTGAPEQRRGIGHIQNLDKPLTGRRTR